MIIIINIVSSPYPPSHHLQFTYENHESESESKHVWGHSECVCVCVCLHQGSQADRCTRQVSIDYEPVETWREEEEEWREEED